MECSCQKKKKIKPTWDQAFRLKTKTINRKRKQQRDILNYTTGIIQQYLDDDNSAWANNPISSRNKLQWKKVEGEFCFCFFSF